MKVENKKYCCSNQLRTETIIIGTVELILSLISWLMLGGFFYYYTFDLAWLKQYAAENVDQGDLRTFFKLSRRIQEFLIIVTFLEYGVAVFASCILLMGAHYKNAIHLKVWVILAFLRFIFIFISIFLFLYKTQHKIFNSIIGLLYIFYCIYTLYIVRLFIKELTCVFTTTTSTSTSQLQMYPDSDIDVHSVETGTESELNGKRH